MKPRHYVGLASLLASTSCSLVSPCGSDDLSYRVTPSDRAIVVGERFTPQAEFLGCRGREVLRDAITWRARDTTIVRVDTNSGEVRGVATGTTFVEWKGARYGNGIPVTVVVR